jgi:hypothetical protein
LLLGSRSVQWFKILILVPVMSLALVGSIAAGIARADNVWSIALMAIAVVTALQIGYLIGIWLRSFIVAARFARPSPASEATRRAPAGVAQPSARDLAGMTQRHDKDQEHSISSLA